MSDDVLEIVRTGKDEWLALERPDPVPLKTDVVVHYLLGRTCAGPKSIKVIDPLREEK